MSGGSRTGTDTGTRTRTRTGTAARPAVAGALLLLVLVAVALAAVPLDVLPGAAPAVDVLRDFTSEQLAREEAFHRALRPPAYASTALGLAVAVLLGLTPAGARLVTAVARPAGGGWVAAVLLGTVALVVVGRLVTLPLDVRSEQVLRAYGLSVQDWPDWLLDVLRSVLVASVGSALVLLVVVGLARRAPGTWWAWAAGSVAVLVVLGSYVYPVVVEPLFSDFRSLAAGPLREDLLGLARADGVPVQDVLVADASRRTTALNAYVSGFGSTRRIVVYDTLVASADPAQVRLVVAHELGHAERDDVLVGTLLGALAAAAGTCLLAAVLRPRLLARAGAGGVGDPRAVPLLLALAAVGALVTAPAAHLVSRRVEARADLHSLRLTGDLDAFVASEQRLAVTNLSDLDRGPWVAGLSGTHPTPPERIALARACAQQEAAR